MRISRSIAAGRGSRRWARTLPAIALALSLPPHGAASAAPAAAAPGQGDVVAREGSIALTTGDVRTLLAELDPASRAKVLAQPGGLTDLVRERLAALGLLQEANAKGWADKPDIAKQIELARRGVIEQSYLASVSTPAPDYPSDADIQATYEDNKSDFTVPKSYHLAQVLIPGAQNAPPKKSPAALYATGTPTDLGTVPENRLSQSLLALLSGMKPGDVSQPVYLQDGWHVIKLLEVKPASVQPLAAVRGQIVDVMRRHRAQQNAKAYLDAMQQKGHLEINEIALGNAVPK